MRDGPKGPGRCFPAAGRPSGLRSCAHAPPTPGALPARAVRYVCLVSNKVNKNALRAGTVAAGVPLMMLLSSPAFALTRDDGDDPGPGLSVLQTLGLYVAIPIALFLVIAGLVAVTDKSRKKQG